MKSPARNYTGILVLNSDNDSHLYPGCADKAQNLFQFFLKIKYPQKANPVKLLWNALSKPQPLTPWYLIR